MSLIIIVSSDGAANVGDLVYDSSPIGVLGGSVNEIVSGLNQCQRESNNNPLVRFLAWWREIAAEFIDT